VLLRLPPARGRLVCVDGEDERAFDVAPEVTVSLPEGRWLVFHEAADGTREPVLAGVRDTRALMAPLDRVAVALPHRRPDAQLGIQVWRRERHVEVGDVFAHGASVTLSGRLFGTRLGDAPALALRAREDGSVERRFPARAVGGDGFRVDIDYAPLVERRWAAHDAWDAFLEGEGEPVRLGRVLDDVYDKKTAYAYPESVVGHARVRPYYTEDNGFSLLVSDPKG
jgi:hypothetical protein